MAFLLAFGKLQKLVDVIDRYRNDSHPYAVELNFQIVERLQQLASSKYPRETGGILVGHYSSDLRCAFVTDISLAPSDSRSTPMTFYRGVKGLGKWLKHLWSEQGRYYLGEWHSHPDGLAHPSGSDIGQMKEIANSSLYRCPEPILLIAGGNPSIGWVLKVFVYPKDQKLIELTK